MEENVKAKEEKARRAGASGWQLGLNPRSGAYARRSAAVARASHAAEAALSDAREKLKEHQKVLNEMKGIKEKPEEKPAARPPAPKGKERSRLTKIRDLLDKLNAKGSEIIAEHGQGSKEYDAYVSKYKTLFEKLDGERKKLSWGA